MSLEYRYEDLNTEHYKRCQKHTSWVKMFKKGIKTRLPGNIESEIVTLNKYVCSNYNKDISMTAEEMDMIRHIMIRYKP